MDYYTKIRHLTEIVTISRGKIGHLSKNGHSNKAYSPIAQQFTILARYSSYNVANKTIKQLWTEKFPLKKGVYETRVEVDGVGYKGITNFGARPTFGNGEVLTETHLLDFTGSLYGRGLRVEFIRYLRAVQRFDDVEQLKIQLEKDSRQVRDHD